MPTKLQIWNEALRFIGETPLATLTDDVEPRYVLADVYDRAVTAVLREADWRFALVTETRTNNAALAALPGFTYKFSKPASWLRTHALFVQSPDSRECPFDARETATGFYANVGSSIIIRYVSSDAATESGWTEHFAKALSAYIAHLIAERITGNADTAAAMLELYGRNFQAAASRDAVPPNPWLPFQLDGTFRRAAQAVLEHGAWRFAVKTATLTASGTASVGYLYRYQKPDDWLRTVDGYDQQGVHSLQGPYRDEGGALHSDRDSLTLRYVSTAGMDATTWSEAFHDAVLAYCQYQSVRDTKNAGDALRIYKDRIKSAENRDELGERPRVIGPGLFVAARRGGAGRFGYRHEQGVPH